MLFRDRSRLGAPAFLTEPVYPIAGDAGEQRQPVRSGHQDAVRAPVFHRLPAFGRPGHGVRNPLRRQPQHERLDDRELEPEETIFENDFIDEFRLAQANLRANVAAGRGAAAASPTRASRARRRCRPTSRTSAALPASRAGDPARTRRRISPTRRGPATSATTSRIRPTRPTTCTRTRRSGQRPITAGLPANFFVMNPAITNANITRVAGGHALQRAAARAAPPLSRGLLVTPTTPTRSRLGSSLQSLRLDRIYLQDQGPERDVPHSFKMQWTYELPVGRGRRFGGEHEPAGSTRSSATGSSPAPAACSASCTTWAACKLVGMSMSELQKAFKIRTVRSDTGTITVFSFPQDIIDNTRRAYNTDPTSLTDYGGDGAPTGRYIAPASTPDCIAIYSGRLRRAAPGAAPRPARDALRHARQEALPVRREGELRARLRSAERVRQHQLQPQSPTPGGGADTFQVTDRLHGHQHDVRSGRPHRADRVAVELVREVGASP